MTNLVSGLGEVTRAHPDEPALWFAGEETTYAELWAMAGRFAAGLIDRGIEPGDPIALYLRNLPQFVVAFHGVLRAGGVVVPINPRYGANEIRPLLQDSLAGAVVTSTAEVPHIKAVHEDTLLQFLVTADGDKPYSTGFAKFLDADAEFGFWEAADREEDDIAMLAYTERPDGEPTGVRLTHGTLEAGARAAADLADLSVDDTVLGALPLFHAAGTTAVMNATLFGGATLYPLVQWEPERALELLDEHALTHFHGVPAMFGDLLAHPVADSADLSSLRLAGSVGPASEVCERFEAEFDVPVCEGYGLTETGGLTHSTAATDGRRIGSVGTPIAGVETRIVDEDFEELPRIEEGPVDGDGKPSELDEATGELVISGPVVMASYHDREADGPFTEADGQRWLHTGDLGYRDEDGSVYVREEAGTVNGEHETAGGYRSFVREIEAFLYGPETSSEDAEERGDEATDDLPDEATDDLPDEPTDDTVADEGLEGDESAEADEEAAEEADAVPVGADGQPSGEHPEGEAAAVVEEPIGEADIEGPQALVDLKGVSDNRAKSLRESGIESIEDLRAASRDDLAEVDGIGESLADRIKSQVEESQVEDTTE